MTENRTEGLIGLDSLCREVERICRQAKKYKYGYRPSHMILNMDPGSGRTTALEYITDMFRENDVIDFSCSRDDFIEITVDSSHPKRIEQVFATIADCADFANEYRNVIGMDITDVSNYHAQVQEKDFLKNIKKVCDDACVIFFVRAVPTSKEETLVKEICKCVDNVNRIDIQPYTSSEMCEIVLKFLASYDCAVSEKTQFCEDLQKVISDCKINTVKQAKKIAFSLIQFADVNEGDFCFDSKCLKKVRSAYIEKEDES